jgi:hypothetical protein
MASAARGTCRVGGVLRSPAARCMHRRTLSSAAAAAQQQPRLTVELISDTM